MSDKTTSLVADRAEMLRHATLILDRAGVTELRALNVPDGGSRTATYSGLYDDPTILVDHAEQLSHRSATGLFLLLNRLGATDGAALNTFRRAKKGELPSDRDIEERLWFLVDVDPVRPSNVSATDAEKALAHTVARAACDHLSDLGFAAPIVGDSGNGFHLLYATSIPASCPFIPVALKALDLRFGSSEVSIDIKVGNPARISKLYGSVARKGPTTPDRPHRLSRILHVPDELLPVPADLLESLADSAPTKPRVSKKDKVTKPRFDLDAWIQNYLPDADGPHPWSGGGSGARKWILRACVWNPEHTNSAMFVVQFGNGAIGAGCHHNGCAGRDWHDLRQLLEPGWQSPSSSSSSSGGDKTQSAELVGIAESETILFHTPGGYESEGFATITLGDHRETWPIGGKPFRRWLAGRFYKQTRKAPSASAMADALAVIAAQAIYDGAEQDVAIRTAGDDSVIWIDVGDPEWHAIRVDTTGFTVVKSIDVPVRFVRRRGMLALPFPVAGGKPDDLREFLNVPNDGEFRLVQLWLVNALRPRGPYIILVVNGEQGSAKTTLCFFLRRLVDPNQAPLRRPPKSERDLMIAASNSRIVAFENVSSLSADLSDALCAVATGSGFAARALYTDDDEKILQATRPIMVNGIADLASRPDFLDRAVILHLPQLRNRRPERELMAQFESALPTLFGSYLTAIAGAIRCLPNIAQVSDSIRMQDSAQWGCAAARELGTDPDTILDAYAVNLDSANATTIEQSAVGPGVLRARKEISNQRRALCRYRECGCRADSAREVRPDRARA